MNPANPYLKQYKKNQIETATPEEVLILLYDGAIQFLNKAKIAFEQEDFSSYSNHLIGAEKIILEFMNTLDMEIGGDLAVNLYRLYEYLYRSLINANLNKDISKVDEVLKILKGLRETWQKAIAIANAEKQATPLHDPEDGYLDQSDDEYESEI